MLYTFASAGKFAGNRAKAMRLKDTHKHHNQNLFRIRDNTIYLMPHVTGLTRRECVMLVILFSQSRVKSHQKGNFNTLCHTGVDQRHFPQTNFCT